jgi:hypothetical protein
MTVRTFTKVSSVLLEGHQITYSPAQTHHHKQLGTYQPPPRALFSRDAFACTYMPWDNALRASGQLGAQAVNSGCDDFWSNELLHNIKDLVAAQQLEHCLASVVATEHWAPDFGRLIPDRGGAMKIVLIVVELRDLAFRLKFSRLLVDRACDLLLKCGDVRVWYEILH